MESGVPLGPGKFHVVVLVFSITLYLLVTKNASKQVSNNTNYGASHF